MGSHNISVDMETTKLTKTSEEPITTRGYLSNIEYAYKQGGCKTMAWAPLQPACGIKFVCTPLQRPSGNKKS